GHQPGGAYVAALEVHRPVVKAEAADMAVTVEARHPFVLRRPIIEVALHAIEGAVNVGGNLAPDLAVVNIGIESRRAVEAGRKQRMTSEIDCHGGSPGVVARAADDNSTTVL